MSDAVFASPASMTARFDAYCDRKEKAAVAAHIPGYVTVCAAPPDERLIPIGSAWSEALFDGPFYRSVAPRVHGTPVTSLVFVQSRDGNTVAPNPSALGGGETDLHLVYEGLSRVDADAVLAGAATARARELVFSVWHPELVALRRALGHPRHPAQVILTEQGDLGFDEGLLYQEPALRVFVITRTAAVSSIRARVRGRPWIEVIDAGDPVSLVSGLRALRAAGIAVLSAVGGRTTATALVREGLVSDVYLTTSAVEAGVPNTPFVTGDPPPLACVLEKAGQRQETGVRFEHGLVI